MVDEIRAAEAAETERVGAVKRLCAEATTLVPERRAAIEAEAIREGWAAERCELQILRDSRPMAPAVFSGEPNMGHPDIMAAAVLLHAGQTRVAEKHLGPAVTQRAEDLRQSSLLDMCRLALQHDGVAVPRGRNEMIRAAFSTVSMPVALGSAAEKVLLEQYRESAATWRTFAAVKPTDNFREHQTVRPSWAGSVEKVGADGELKHGTLSEATGTFKVDTFGKVLGVTRQDVVNDDLGFLNDAAAMYGRMAARGVSDLVWETILANGASFFSDANSNSLGAEALDVDAFDSALQAMRTQRDGDGNDLDIVPRVLAVPPELDATARGILESAELEHSAGVLTAADKMPTGNALKAACDLAVESRISNTTKFPDTASTTQWYVLAGPIDAPVIVAFLHGVETPTIEFFGLEHDVNTLGLSWRVYLDYGVALNDPRAAVKSAGA